MHEQRPPAWAWPAIGFAIPALLAALLLAFVSPGFLRGDGAPAAAAPARGAPPLIQVLRPGGGLGAAVAGFGDLWMDERGTGRLLRVSSPGGRLIAALPVRGRLMLAAGAGGVWALQQGGYFSPYLRGPLLHIDPATNRVRARVELRTPAGDGIAGLGVYARGGRVWVWGPRDILRIDPRTDRVAQHIPIDDRHGDIDGLALLGRRLVVATADGTFLALDARTGRRVSATPTPFGSPTIRLALGSRLVITSRGRIAALDPVSGRVAWVRRVGFRAGAVVKSHGLLWINSADFHEPGDRLSGFDPATGERVTTSLLPAFGTTGVVALGGRLISPSATGRLLVITLLML